MRILFITGNENKLEEARAILGPDIEIEAQDIDLPEIQSLDPEEVIKAKLIEARRHISGPFFVEDTSLFFDAWNGLPGPLIKWFLKSVGNQGLWDMLQQGVSTHGAEARSVIGYVDQQDQMHFFTGRLGGQIVSPSGSTQFGWDPIFLPFTMPVGTKTFADMTPEEKNAISMRRKALEGLRTHLLSQR